MYVFANVRSKDDFLIFSRPRELPPRLVRGTFAPSEGLLTSAAFQVE